MAIFFFSENSTYCPHLHVFESAHLTQRSYKKKKKGTLTVLDASSNYKLIIWLYKDVEDFGNSSVFS